MVLLYVYGDKYLICNISTYISLKQKAVLIVNLNVCHRTFRLFSERICNFSFNGLDLCGINGRLQSQNRF